MSAQKQITLSTDPDLFFCTDAAAQSSKEAGHTEHQAKQFEKAVRAAIFAGEIGNYDKRTGDLIGVPSSHTALLTVRLADVHDWIARSSYKDQFSLVTAAAPTSNSAKAAVAISANSKTPETLAFERHAFIAMTEVWNDWKFNKARDPSLREPTKNEMGQAALNKLLEKNIKGKRKSPTLSMVLSATRSWEKPASMKVLLDPALAPKNRHPFKAEK